MLAFTLEVGIQQVHKRQAALLLIFFLLLLLLLIIIRDTSSTPILLIAILAIGSCRRCKSHGLPGSPRGLGGIVRGFGQLGPLLRWLRVALRRRLRRSRCSTSAVALQDGIEHRAPLLLILCVESLALANLVVVVATKHVHIVAAARVKARAREVS